jgi:hypothetical protein
MACGICRRVGIGKSVRYSIVDVQNREARKIMVGILNCLMNTHAVKVGLISCKRTAMVSIHAPAFYLGGFKVFQGDGLAWFQVLVWSSWFFKVLRKVACREEITLQRYKNI